MQVKKGQFHEFLVFPALTTSMFFIFHFKIGGKNQLINIIFYYAFTGPGGPPGQPGVQVTGQPQAQAPVFIPRSQPPVKRERKGIQIIDPNTLQPIDITGDSTPTASVSVSRSSPASVVPNVDVSETRPNIDNEDVSEVYMNYSENSILFFFVNLIYFF